jgi:AcrR family transcriptional regulator
VPTKRSSVPAKRAKPATTARTVTRGKARKGARLGRPVGKASAETRAAILAAAREQFVRVGYERATNRDIAAAAGVTAAAIYQYFASKTDLYVAVASTTMDEILPRLRAATADARSARAALAAILRDQLSDAQQVRSARFLAGIPVEMQRHPEVARAMVAHPGTVFELVLEIIGRGVHRGEIAPEKAESVVGAYFAAMIGVSIHGVAVGGSHSEAAARGIIELLEGTLFR